MNDPLWYKDAVIYEAHVKSFFDSNNDGIGDFNGLTQKLDYLQGLGVTCLWLLPFFPSPLKDDGYDVADYENVHPSYGTLDDFTAFVDAAHARNIKVLIELVVNHTSDQHPWFQRARMRAGRIARARASTSGATPTASSRRRGSSSRDTEKSNWTWDAVAGQYYWHRFFSHQPDLNHNNPAVVDAVIDVLRFWLDRGVDALRLDAVPYLCVREGTSNENLAETHAVLQADAPRARRAYPDRMLLAEANQWPSDVRPYFGDGDECHMAFHFPLMPRMFMALRQEDRHAITEILNQTPDIPDDLPVGAVPAQPRRADARDGHRRGARLHVLGLRQRSADADQRRHPPAAGAAGREQPAAHRAAERRCCSRCRARRSSTTATRSAWATTSTSAIATACARRCSGAAIATAASRAPTRRGCSRRRSWIRSTATRRSTSRRRSAIRSRC